MEGPVFAPGLFCIFQRFAARESGGPESAQQRSDPIYRITGYGRPMSGRIDFLDLQFDDIDADAMVAILRTRRADAPFAYVVTPNVDHIVRLSRADAPPDVREAYAAAGWCLCDSRILGRLAKLHGLTLRVVPGSDLTAKLISDVLAAGDRLCLIGGRAGDIAALTALRPDVIVVQHIPPPGLARDADARTAAARFAVDAQARLTLIAVGSPQQELIAAEIAQIPGPTGTALCIGASLDFLTGRTRRAPIWMQRASLEWLHRLLSDPARLWRRYLIEGPRIFMLTWRWSRRR